MAGATTLGSGSPDRDGTRIRSVNVMDFGAKADGVTDDTAAFNRATRAADEWQKDVQCLVRAPAGNYRVDGPVCVRKGQFFQGDGYATLIDARMSKGHTFVLGSGLGREGKIIADPGGAPVGIAGLRSIGGAARGAFIFTDAQGFSIKNLFLSAVGTGLHIAGADGLISDLFIDQALNGIIFDGCQNIIVNLVEFYVANYGATFLSNSRDIIIGEALFCYSAYSAIFFGEGSEHIHNVLFSNCSCIMNAQPETFSGFVHVRSSVTDAKFVGCTFRNWSNFAVAHGAGNVVQLSFDGCTFDASKTTSLYNGSDNSKILSTSLGGEYDFNACKFLNLSGPLARIGSGLKRLEVKGGRLSSASATRIECSQPPAGQIRIADLSDFVPANVSNGLATVLLPWWGANTVWQVSLLISSADASVIPIEVVVTTITKNGIQTCGVEVWNGAATDQVALTMSLGDRPGSATTKPSQALSGLMCMSVVRKTGKITGVQATARTFA